MTGRRVPLRAGLATSIGSLPHVDPSDAVDFVLRHTPGLPAAPTLPARSPREGMVAQSLLGVAGIEVADDGSFEVDAESLSDALDRDLVEASTAATATSGPARAVDPVLPAPGFGGEGWSGLRAFLNAVSDRDGPIKLQLTGPVTVGVALHASGLDLEVAFAAASRIVRRRVVALLDLLDDRLPQCTRVVFLDEPALVGTGAPGFPLPPDLTADLLSGSLAALEGRAISGVHVCGAADWKVVLQAGPDIVSCPAEEEALMGSAEAFAAFLERDGWIAWGAVPTHEPVGTTVDRLWRRVSALWCLLVQEGCDPVRLRTQAMITPACGLAGHGVTQAEQVMSFTTELAKRLGDQAIGVRLQVGA